MTRAQVLLLGFGLAAALEMHLHAQDGAKAVPAEQSRTKPDGQTSDVPGTRISTEHLEITTYTSDSAVAPGSGFSIVLNITPRPGMHVYAPGASGYRVIALNFAAGQIVRPLKLVFPASQIYEFKPLNERVPVYQKPFTLRQELVLEADQQARAVMRDKNTLTVSGSLEYQACDDKICFNPVSIPLSWTLALRPQVPEDDVAAVPARAAQQGLPHEGAARLDDFMVLGSAGGYLGSEDFLTFIHNAENGVRDPGLFGGRGTLAILVIVLFGGLALNLTPCVLPMIPINLAIIGAGAQAGSRRRGFMLGGAYGLSMALVYGVLGLAVVLTAGTFGTINAPPWFNAGIASLFVVLALAMFDVVSIDLSRFSSRFGIGDAKRGTFPMAFTMGAVAALLAGACVAPAVIQVVALSSSLYAGGTTAALALPFLLGIGMAMPCPIAGAGIAALPKPGLWMVRIKQAFGVVILATAVYYGYIAYGLFADRLVDPAQVSSSVAGKLKEGWYSSLAEGLAAAQREQKPVLIDLWATWCKNCFVMDKTTLADPVVIAAMSRYVKIKFQAENPDETPAKEVMQRLGAVGLPTYAIVSPRP